MEKLTLPPRLAALADCVPAGSRLADVGTDHGLLPIYLTLCGRAVSAVASDLRPGPLARAEENAAAFGAGNIRFLLADGLDGIGPRDADTVVIAGMGGINIAGILSRAPWTRQRVHMVLQPMSRPEELRAALGGLSLRVTSERLVEDSGRLYPILTAEGGESADYTPIELHTGLYTQIAGDALFPRLLDALEEKFSAALLGLSRSTRAEDGQRARHIRALLEGIAEMRRRKDA